METKQTAVDYIVNVVNSCIAPDYIPNEIVIQAKQMEKEQIMDAYYYDPNCDEIKDDGEQYYNETYGGQESNTNTEAVGYKALEHKEPVVVGTLRGPNNNTTIYNGDAVISRQEINPFKKDAYSSKNFHVPLSFM